jgi:uncharacterized coiled-coil protein SlyX
MSTTSASRLVSIEEKLAFVEKYAADLDGVVRSLHSEVRTLRTDVAALRQRLEGLETLKAVADEAVTSDDADPAAHKPPHY